MSNTKSWNDLADLQQPDYSSYNNLLIVDAIIFHIDGSKDQTIILLELTLSVQFNP